MGNNTVVGVEPWGGRSRAVILDHTGPASYVQGGEPFGQSTFGGPNVLGLAGFYWLENGASGSLSGNYTVQVLYGGTGVRQKVFLKWLYAGNNQGVNGVVIATAGSGQTPGTYTATASTGSAVLQYTIAAGGTLTGVKIIYAGTGYTAVPTFTIAAGGTPGTVTATVGFVNDTEVAAGTNLSGETVRLLAIGG